MKSRRTRRADNPKTSSGFSKFFGSLLTQGDQGWLFRNEIREGKAVITATRNGLEKDFPVIPFEETFFDRYAKKIKNRDILPADLPDIREAYEDLRILLEN